jgi:hypothetical protein
MARLLPSLSEHALGFAPQAVALGILLHKKSHTQSDVKHFPSFQRSLSARISPSPPQFFFYLLWLLHSICIMSFKTRVLETLRSVFVAHPSTKIPHGMLNASDTVYRKTSPGFVHFNAAFQTSSFAQLHGALSFV